MIHNVRLSSSVPIRSLSSLLWTSRATWLRSSACFTAVLFGVIDSRLPTRYLRWAKTARGQLTDQGKPLLAGCVKGEQAAWDAFVLQYSKLAYSTIRKTFALHHALPQDDLVGDLYQDFFLSLCENDFRKLGQFRGDRGGTLASWLRVVASRLTIDFSRKQQASTVEFAGTLSSD